MFNDLIGKKIVSSYDSIGQYNPIQIIYWIVNPYYERVAEQVGIKEKLLELRETLYSCEFLNYALEQLNDILEEDYDYLGIDNRFQSIIKGMFSCPVNGDVKAVLGKVNAAYRRVTELK